MKKAKLLIVANVDWFFISHRICIAEKALENNWEVFVACKDTGMADLIRKKGINFIDLPFTRSGTNILEELATINRFRKLYNKIEPDVVHHVTFKPVIYGSLIAKIKNINGVVNAVSGLGYNFTSGRKSFVQKVMVCLMRYGFKNKKLTVIFQNGDDHKAFEEMDILSPSNKVVRIKGSGVDLDRYSKVDFPSFDNIKILFPARMLWDKGVKELRMASDILRKKYRNKITFILVGMADGENKAGVSKDYLNDWQDGEYVKWLDYQKDMVEVYQNSHIVVLPSYREGMPKSLLEACSAGRPIITTDAIGCRECVDEGINGLKVPVYSVELLADAIEKLINDEKLIIEMGRNSRIKAELEFDVDSVVKKHLEIYSNLLN